MEAPARFPDVVEIVVEIPRGSRNKYEYDEEAQVFRLDRVLSSAVFYNFDYGFIEGTRAGDGDHTDALLVIDEPTFTGCHVWARPIGGLEMRDEKGFDFKVLCVALGDAHQQHIERLDQVRPHRLVEIEHFFQTYKALEDKAVDVVGWRDHEAALEVLREDRDGCGSARPADRARTDRARDPAGGAGRPVRRACPGRRLFVAVPLPEAAAAAVVAVVDGVRAAGLPAGGARRPLGPPGRPAPDPAVPRADPGRAELGRRGRCEAGRGRHAGPDRRRARRRRGVPARAADPSAVARHASRVPRRSASWPRRVDAELTRGRLASRSAAPFRPHLTLARSDGVAAGPLVADRLVDGDGATGASGPLDRLGLFESVTGGGPARYVPVDVGTARPAMPGSGPGVYHQSHPGPALTAVQGVPHRRDGQPAHPTHPALGVVNLVLASVALGIGGSGTPAARRGLRPAPSRPSRRVDRRRRQRPPRPHPDDTGVATSPPRGTRPSQRRP